MKRNIFHQQLSNLYSTLYVQNLLSHLPSNTKKLALVINSNSGSLSQAHIINSKLNVLSQK